MAFTHCPFCGLAAVGGLFLCGHKVALGEGLEPSLVPNQRDCVINRHYIMVPRDMKCHKCGAEEPWRDADRKTISDELAKLEPKP